MQGPLFSDIIQQIILLQFQLVRGRFTHSAIEAFHQNFLAHYNGLGIFDQTQKTIQRLLFLTLIANTCMFSVIQFLIFIFILTCQNLVVNLFCFNESWENVSNILFLYCIQFYNNFKCSFLGLSIRARNTV